jgi:hypothetical protein
MQEAGDAPEPTQWLDRTRRLGLSYVHCFPSELIEDSTHDLFRLLVVPANEFLCYLPHLTQPNPSSLFSGSLYSYLYTQSSEDFDINLLLVLSYHPKENKDEAISGLRRIRDDT